MKSKASRNYSIRLFERWNTSSLSDGINSAKRPRDRDLDLLPFVVIVP